MLCFFIFLEICEFKEEEEKKKDYFLNMWNALDFISYSFTTVAIVFNFLYIAGKILYKNSYFKAIYSLMIFSMWIRMISYLRGSRFASFYIRLLIKVIFDIQYFFAIIVCIFI